MSDGSRPIAKLHIGPLMPRRSTGDLVDGGRPGVSLPGLTGSTFDGEAGQRAI